MIRLETLDLKRKKSPEYAGSHNHIFGAPLMDRGWHVKSLADGRRGGVYGKTDTRSKEDLVLHGSQRFLPDANALQGKMPAQSK